jgi:integrase
MQSNTTRRRSYGTGSLEKRQNADGSQSWVAVWREHGRRRKETLGRVGRDGLSEKQAELAMVKLRGEPIVARRGTSEQLTLAQVAERYLEVAERRERKRSTRENVESEVRIHLVPFFGERPFAKIEPEDVEDLIATLAAKGLAPKTIRNIIGTLSALFNFAKAPARRWAASNACDGAELPRAPEPRETRYLRREEIARLIEHAPAGIYQELDRVLWLVASQTGLRRSELLALRWRDVDWVASRIRVRRGYVRGESGPPKSRRSVRSVPMSDEVGGVLDRWSQAVPRGGEDDLVFGHPVTGEPQPAANILRRMRRALEAAGLDTAHTFHDLRHTFGTQLAADGVPARTIQGWFGHEHATTTDRYVHYAPSEVEVALVNRAFTGAGTSRGQSEPI